MRRDPWCKRLEDYALAAIGGIYLLMAVALEKLGLIRGRR